MQDISQTLILKLDTAGVIGKLFVILSRNYLYTAVELGYGLAGLYQRLLSVLLECHFHLSRAI